MTIPVIDRQLDGVRRRLVGAVTSRMYGGQPPPAAATTQARREDPWLPEDSPVRQVHADIAMLVGGLRALLLQSLHPQAMQAVFDHSNYRVDTWGRLQRTGAFVGATSFGSVSEARTAIDQVRAIHQHIRGTGPLGPYHASDPHLLLWVHAAELDSFLTAYRLYGRDRLDRERADRYVADMARTGEALGIDRAPRSLTELERVLADFRPELQAGPATADAAQVLLWNPPVTGPARAGYAVIAGGAVAALPVWARTELGLPALPIADRTVFRPAARMLLGTLDRAFASVFDARPA
jgi:uncharacterized protein (DUF2236 family)